MAEDHDEQYTLTSTESLSFAEDLVSLNSDIVHERMLNDDMAMSGTMARAVSRPQELTAQDVENDPAGFRRRRSTIAESIMKIQAFQRVQKFGWWDTELKRDRLKVYSALLRNYVILCIILTIALSFMWGTYYKRETRYVNLKMLIVSEDEQVGDILPIVGISMNATTQLDSIRTIGGWEFKQSSDFITDGRSVREQMIHEVHRQRYWSAFHVNPNATYELYNAIIRNDTSFTLSESLVEVIYENGRDLMTMSSYVTRFQRLFETAFIEVIRTQYHTLTSELNETSLSNAAYFLSQPPTFLYTDMKPADTILMAPFQLGLTYLVIFAFFKMTMTIRVEMYLSTVVHGTKFLLYKFIWAQVAYLILSLAYTILNVGFGITYRAAFGHSGALVMWAVGFLTIASLGTLTEIVASLCFLYFPPLIGGWLLFLMVVNVAPTTSSMALTNHFYRYGYAMPIHNSYELFKVIFCDTYKGEMGRNIGILLAWFIMANCLSPFVMIFVAKKRARMAKLEALEKSHEKAST